MAKRGRGRRRGGRGRVSFRVPAKVQKVLTQARATVRTVQVVGQIKGGVLEIRQSEVAAVARKARRGITFVALNAPFKTRAVANPA